MARLKDLARDEMNPEQQAVYDKVMASPRSGFNGPYKAWIRSPKLTAVAEQYGAFCRFQSSVSDRVREFAILVVARHWNADVEWWAHHPIAIKAGLDPHIAEAIKVGQRPEFVNRDEEITYDLITQLAETRRVSDATYASAIAEFGEVQLVELMAIIGNYFAVALTLNCFEIEPPDGSKPMTG